MVQFAVRAGDIRPGDHLPPQAALHGTLFQATGFTVGSYLRDVVDAAVLPGRLLLFGPQGSLDSLLVDSSVTVQRHVA